MKTPSYTLHTGTLGHRSWLIGRKNKALTTGKTDFASALEIAFAYATDPVELHKLQGKAADDAIKAFEVPLTNDDFETVLEHAVAQLSKFNESSVVPKKKQVTRPRVARKSPRKR